MAAVVEGIGKLIAEERWQTYSTAGIQLAAQQFSLQPISAQYLALLAELQQGAYPLPIQRTRLRRTAPSPLRWKDYLPRLLREFYQIGKHGFQRWGGSGFPLTFYRLRSAKN